MRKSILFFMVLGVVLFSCKTTDEAVLSEPESEDVSTIAEQINTELKDEIDNGEIQLFQYDEVLVISIGSRVLFDPDSSQLKEEFKPVLLELSRFLMNESDKIIRVEGYTASARVNRVDSWQLGADRAVNVLRFMQLEGGVDPTRLVAVSYGEYRPVESNDDDIAKVQNRRVQIVLVDKPVYQTEMMNNQ